MSFDAVIVGAGPAGILVWEQLTAAGLNAALLEAGPKATGKLIPTTDETIWAYQTAKGEALQWPRTHVVGGRTVGWGGLCFRFPDAVFKRGGWPYSARTLAPYYAAAEAWLGVEDGRLHEHHRRAARNLGWHMLPLRSARRGGHVWTANQADGARAARPHHIVSAIECNDKSATAIRMRTPKARDHRMTARAFVLAAGPIESARLLLASDLGRVIPLLGRRLVRHPFVSYMLAEPEPAPRSINPYDFLDGALVPFPDHGFAVEVVGPLPMSETLNGELRKRGLFYQTALARVTYVNAMSETEPNAGSRVSLSRAHFDALERPLPIIRLSTTNRDRQRITRMKAACVAIAEAVARPGAELFLLEEPAPNRYLFHEAGTCVMGSDPASPCNSWGRLRSIDNVWIADASVFPSAGDRHPTLTVLAHASRVAQDMRWHLGG